MDVVKSPKPARAAEWSTIATDWLQTDGLTWLYMAKVLLAVFLSLFIAMKLELPQPRTAMTTVFIVMQPQSGMVFAKSFYRICGTLVGLVVMLALVGLFPQQPEPFIVCTALWVGICTAGAARNRNFRSYGFVLAGYTAALIGIPASQHPDSAFLSALTRVAEVVLGIVCAGAVSALVFPQHIGPRMRTSAGTRFQTFVDYVCALMGGRIDPDSIESANADFIADAISFESSRSMVLFEGPEGRRRTVRLARLNAEFMAAATRLHALHQLMDRLRTSQSAAVVVALHEHFREIPPLLCRNGTSSEKPEDAAVVANQLHAYRTTLADRATKQRSLLTNESAIALLEFETGIELLRRFVDDMQALAATYASLVGYGHARDDWDGTFEPKTSMLAACVAGVRAALVVTLLGSFWITTAWPSGTTFTLVGAAICALVSSTANPSRTARQMAGGTILAAIAGMLATFGLYPRIDGFPLLCVALTPFLLLGLFMSVRPQWAGYGVGYCIFFCFLAGPDNMTVFAPDAFINDAIALVLAMLASSLSYAVFAPPAAAWLRRLLLIEIRRHIITACDMPVRRDVRHFRSRFESSARDLAFQLLVFSGSGPAARKEALRWFFIVIEIGSAMIDLHQACYAPLVEKTPRDAKYFADLDTLRNRIGGLFRHPTRARFNRALSATRAATDAATPFLEEMSATELSDERGRRIWQIVGHLHLIRSALLDPQSPLEEVIAKGNSEATRST
ncbi:FUSC family protein [Burkholderia sp. BCC1993]|uniref:FUSC family protein n=1 Tax=Burkholderia sp. BCC1993 TaxID=2817444 RepID=UPI002AB114F8|nr:FUSC family protein [Burkholderia sp. BCC1993]